ncbi:MAG: sodium:solute symporter [Muribaculaceae bacterium]|nr:sodium:solute symporter [Muribaculaceae bacterium]MDE6322300.1 sodium:solute symporter [Muribaculaceae bacterium]
MDHALTVILTIAAYFALLLIISYFASRRSNNSTFFTGDRRAPWALVAFAMVGAAISGVTFISVPGMVAAKGYSYLQMVLGFIVGYFVIAFVLVPLFYKRNLVSIYGYLDERFGNNTYKTSAWYFFVSKMLGASVRFLVVCVVLQALVFEPLHIPFIFNVIVTIGLIWLYTVQGGVKTLIWTDTLKSFCLIMSVVLCIYFVATNLGMSFGEMTSAIGSHSSSRMFFLDNPMEGTYFWKQFLAGVFMAIATNGLDQDMMQRNLACKDTRQSQKNMIVSGIMQFFVVALFLLLGTMLMIYMDSKGITAPEKSDEIFSLVAHHADMPVIVGILFVLGLISAAYSAAGSALTSLTTSFTVDIIEAPKRQDDTRLAKTRKRVHIAMSAVMGLVIIAFYYLSDQDAISAVYTLASYTYGPILGLFVYGLFWSKPVHDRWVPAVCIAAPILSWVIQWALKEFGGYETSFELLIINAALTTGGLRLLSVGARRPAAAKA